MADMIRVSRTLENYLLSGTDLPPCAQAVREGCQPTADYLAWLAQEAREFEADLELLGMG